MGLKVVVSMDQRKSSVYHRYGCRYAERIRYKNQMIVARGDARQQGYRACKCCCGLGGDLRAQINARNVDKWQETMHVALTYDKRHDRLFVRTRRGFWQIRSVDGGELYLLYHLNHFDELFTTQYMMKQSFHRQTDVKQTASLGGLIKYIYRHDQAKEIMDVDYRNLPRSTKRQKKYYRQAKKREQRRSIRRVDELFAMLDRERMTVAEA